MTAATTSRPTADQIKAALAHHSGSLERYRHWIGGLLYTPGVRDLAELCGAHWLIDLVASHQPDPKARAEEFQSWRLKVADDRTAVTTMDDGNGRVVITQHIEFTDFPLDEITLYLTDGVLLLPGEY